MLVFTPDLIKHVFPRGLAVGDNRRLWSLVVIKLTNSANLPPIAVGVSVRIISRIVLVFPSPLSN